MSEQYDVIVVGAGPAGSTAARFAASKKARTLLLEKHPVIGYPLCCAEAISVSGLSQVVKPDPKWIASRIEKVRLFGPGGSRAVISHPNAGFVLERKIFDRSLAEMAARAGADVLVGIDVTDLITKHDGRVIGVAGAGNGRKLEFYARTIIAADGVESQIALKAGLPTLLKPGQLHSAYQYLLSDLDIETETIEFHIGTDIAPGGYIWIFPKEPGLANVGLGICPSKSPRKKAIEYLDEFVARRFSRPKILERMTGAVPSYMPRLPLYKDNILLAGDAGRVVDSLTGAGIANALLSGKLAGETAAVMAQNGAGGQAYAEAFYKIKQKELKFYYHCREVFLKMTNDDFASVLEFTQDILGDRNVTAINPFEVIKKILLAHPRLLKIGRHLLF